MSTTPRTFISAYSPNVKPEQAETPAVPATPVTVRGRGKYRIEPNLSTWGQPPVMQPHVANVQPQPFIQAELNPIDHSIVADVEPQTGGSMWNSAPASVVLPTHRSEPALPPRRHTDISQSAEQLRQAIREANRQNVSVTHSNPYEFDKTAKVSPVITPNKSAENPIVDLKSVSTFAHLPSAESFQLGEFVCINSTDAETIRAWQTPASVEYREQIPQKMRSNVVVEENLPEIQEQKPIAEQVPEITKPIETPVSQPQVVQEEVVEQESEPQGLWEVDHYLYPAITDQLLENYSYFSQAGKKLQQAASAGLKILAITGLGRESGRSTLAICLARAAAQAGMKVGLLDADFENPALASLLGLDIQQGWEEVISGNATLPEITICAIEEGITLYPLMADNAIRSLRDKRLAQLVKHAAEKVDILLLDLGPWTAALHEPAALPFDAAIVVRDCRHETITQLEPLANYLQECGIEAVGFAENFSIAGEA